ncbi:hypothetical protein BD779DRAFT_1707613 [Infundibulicybe gibba]|nr:hypothetical protein BD779DRAFT_1707613 [Infundibulicybe gibba]
MGNRHSLFYPGNENRYNRARRFGSDCETFKYQSDTKKADLEHILGSYQSEINRIMKAFGYDDFGDLGWLRKLEPEKLSKNGTTLRLSKARREIKGTVGHLDGLQPVAELCFGGEVRRSKRGAGAVVPGLINAQSTGLGE